MNDPGRMGGERTTTVRMIRDGTMIPRRWMMAGYCGMDMVRRRAPRMIDDGIIMRLRSMTQNDAGVRASRHWLRII